MGLPGLTPGAFPRNGLGRCEDLVFLFGGVIPRRCAVANVAASGSAGCGGAGTATSAAASCSCAVASGSTGGATAASAVWKGRGLDAAGRGAAASLL